MNPLTELLLFVRVQPLIEQLQKECGMKLSTNVVVQILGTVAQGVNVLSPVITSDKGKAVAAFSLAMVQSLTALLAHWSNPDGTSARTAYTDAPKAAR